MRRCLHVVPIILFAFMALAPAAETVPTDFSFTGTFSADDDIQLFHFSTDDPFEVTLRSLSYGGGINAEGDLIPPGGFDPILSLFDSEGLLAVNDDGPLGNVNVDPVTGGAFDVFLQLMLSSGSYTAVLSQFDNFFLGGQGDPISTGFARQGQPSFTGDLFGGVPGGRFFDIAANQRTGFWAFDISLDVEPTPVIPEPSALLLMGLGLGALVLWKRRRAA